MPPPLPHDRSGRETPVSVDSIPLEWDPTVDVGGSSMHENDEEGAYYNPLSGKVVGVYLIFYFLTKENLSLCQ